jgi:hypothetical protein
MTTKVSGLIKAGAVMYMLWGVVHFFGVMNGLIYLTQGSDAFLAAQTVSHSTTPHRKSGSPSSTAERMAWDAAAPCSAWSWTR